MDTNLKNALIIIGVLFVIYVFISPQRSCISEAEPYKSFSEWDNENLYRNLTKTDSERRVEYNNYKRDYERMIKDYCRRNNSW